MADSTGKSPRRPPGTAERILDIAQRMVQQRGYNALSYAEIAVELGIAKASLHHHYPTKASLGEALLRRHLARSHALLAEILASAQSPTAQLTRFAEIYRYTLEQKLGCMCGIMLAEFPMLPEPVQHLVREFFALNEQWLAGVVSRGRAAGEISRSGGSDIETARAFIGGLQGALLLARSQGDAAVLCGTANAMLAALKAK